MKIKVLSRSTLKTLLENRGKALEDVDFEYLKDIELLIDIDPRKCLFISVNNYAAAPDFGWPTDPVTGLECSPIPDDLLDRTLVLHFDDVTQGCIDAKYSPYKVFNKALAKQIVKFLNEKLTTDINMIVVHCTAGISRSGAIGTVLNDYYNRFLEENKSDWNYFNYAGHERVLSPNPTVSRYLRKELGMSYDDSAIDQD